MLQLWGSCSPTSSLALDSAPLLVAWAVFFIFIYLLSARPFSSFSFRFSSDTSGRISISTSTPSEAQFSQRIVRRQFCFFSVQHASLVTSRRRFSASTCRFAFNLDSWDGLFYSVGLLTTRSLTRTILCSLFGIGTIERRFLHPTGYSLLFRTPPSHRSESSYAHPLRTRTDDDTQELAKRLLLAFGLNLMEWKRWGSDY